ncbi:MAG: C10 family peptidase [Bacteroides sp.]|nr:C10 family peptidase [Bacteroides sp.]MCM1413864.1 C10 family peptidase [Bacteroides sp.]MCM1471027.1 C10 family peptidase [Bacteroides sp.]
MILGVGLTQARQLSPEEAFAAVTTADRKLMNPNGSNTTTRFSLLHTEKSADLSAVYVMQSGSEILFVAADDVASPLLGWCDADAGFDAESMPESMKWLLATYAEEIAYAVEHNLPAYQSDMLSTRPADTYAVSGLSDIAPLLSTRWNQSSPYNDKCPVLNGTRCPTGCVATAMAQIINHHKSPERGIGQVQYTWKQNSNQTLSLDLSTLTFDWDNMSDTYSSSSTQAEKDAVATLMMACGYTVSMAYTATESGAQSNAVPTALINNFGFAKTATYLSREVYPLNEWIALLHNELANNRPVYYSGRDTGGHAFVVDGYRSGNYFHINWGWGGTSDGYFLITALDPSQQGIGGSSSGYNYDQAAVVGIQKDFDGADYVVRLEATDDFSTSASEYTRSDLVIFGDTPDYFIGNQTATTLEPIYFGVRLTDVSNGQTSMVLMDSDYSLPQGYGIPNFFLYASQFPTSGEYIVEAAARVAGKDYLIYPPIRCIRQLRLTATADRLVFTQIKDEPVVAVDGLTQTSRSYSGTSVTIDATARCTSGEFYGKLTPKLGIMLGSRLTTFATGNAILVDLPEGDSLPLSFEIPLSGVVAGKYYVVICNPAGDIVSTTPLEVEVLAMPEGTPSLTLTGLSCNADEGEGTYRSPWTIPTNRIELLATVHNESGLYNGRIRGFIFPPAGGTSLDYLGDHSFMAGPGESVEVAIKSDLYSLADEETYFFCLYYIDNFTTSGTETAVRFPEYYYITTSGRLAAIEEIAVDGDDIAARFEAGRLLVESATGISRIDVYSLTGQLLAGACFDTAVDRATLDVAAGPVIVLAVDAQGRRHAFKVK